MKSAPYPVSNVPNLARSSRQHTGNGSDGILKSFKLLLSWSHEANSSHVTFSTTCCLKGMRGRQTGNSSSGGKTLSRQVRKRESCRNSSNRLCGHRRLTALLALGTLRRSPIGISANRLPLLIPASHLAPLFLCLLWLAKQLVQSKVPGKEHADHRYRYQKGIRVRLKYGHRSLSFLA